MAARVAGAGYQVTGYDVSADACARWSETTGSRAASSPGNAAREARAVVLMLPDSDVVSRVLLQDGVLDVMTPGNVLIDMSSSHPARTRQLAEQAKTRGIRFVDAPVSGGVSGARSGSLTVMVGGDDHDLDRVRLLLSVMGARILHCGATGAGASVKALNNLLSAVHLLSVSEVMETVRRAGIDPETALSVFNASSGQSGSTLVKWPRYVLPGTFDSGFELSLMLKDIEIALDLAGTVDAARSLSQRAVDIWADAAAEVDRGADHTEIARWIATRSPTSQVGARPEASPSRSLRRDTAHRHEIKGET